MNQGTDSGTVTLVHNFSSLRGCRLGVPASLCPLVGPIHVQMLVDSEVC